MQEPPDHQIRIPRLLVAASELSWRFLVCVAALAVCVFALTRVSFVVFPAVIALLLSTLLIPPARFLQRHHLGAARATVLVFIGAFALVGTVAALLAPAVSSEIDNLGTQVRGGADELARLIGDLGVGVSEGEVQSQIDRIDDRIRENGGAIRSGVLTGAQAAGQFIAGLTIVLVVLFFLVKDGPAMWGWFCRLFPPARRPALDDFGTSVWDALTAYVGGVVIIATVDAVGIGLGLWLIGVPLVIPLAVLVFALAFVPIVGAYVSGAIATLVALVSEGPVAALLVVGMVVLVQQLEGSVLFPAIVGRRTEVHPVAVLLIVAVGGLLYGIVGAALALPVALVVMSAAKVVERHSVHGEVAVGPPPAQEGLGPEPPVPEAPVTDGR